MKPIIALVGRPNVGKSTLFNRLTRTQDALVADFAGLTRDRQYGDGVVGGWDYTVVDTGGLSGAPETLDAAMAAQTLVAVREADLTLFLTDGRGGRVGVDEDIAVILRREARALCLVVNKIDGVGEDKALLDFYALGIEPVLGIAASHNRGLHSLMEQAAEMLGIDPAEHVGEGRRRGRRRGRGRHADAVETAVSVDEAGQPVDPAGLALADDDAVARDATRREQDIRIAFVGRPNVGKSTLINRLIGEDRVVAYDQPGTTRDAVEVPFTRGDKRYTLIDTAGVRRRGKVSEKIEIFSIIKTLKAIDECNVVVMLLDAAEGATDQDLHLLGHTIDKGRALIVAVNKWDTLSSEARDNMREHLERRVAFLEFTRIHFISALSGSGVADLFKSIHRAHRSAFIDLSASRLTRLLELAVTQHQPPMANGRRIKFRYAHQGGVNPPIIVVHGNQDAKVPAAYRRFLTNHFIRVLRLFGTPLRIEFKKGDNPFADRGRKPGRASTNRSSSGRPGGKRQERNRTEGKRVKRDDRSTTGRGKRH